MLKSLNLSYSKKKLKKRKIPITPACVCLCDKGTAVGFNKCVCYSRTRTRAHSPPKAILLQGTIRSTFLRSGEWHSILNRHNITKKTARWKQICLFRKKYVWDSWWTAGQCSCIDDLTVLSVWVWRPKGAESRVYRDLMNHRGTLTIFRDLLQHSLLYELLTCAPRRHLSLQLCHQ